MRVIFRIRMCVMQTVEDRVSAGRHIRRSLRDKSKNIKKALPEFTHMERTVSSISVEKKRLRKQRQIPMSHKKNQYSHALRAFKKLAMNLRRAKIVRDGNSF